MNSMAWAFDWLSGAALMSLVISALGSAAALVCREPVRRMRVVTLTLAGCLLAPLVALLPGLPRWSVPEWGPAVEVERAGAKPQALAMAAREVQSERAGEAALAGRPVENATTESGPGQVTEPHDDPAPPVAMIEGDAADETQTRLPEPRGRPEMPAAKTPPVSATATPALSVETNELRRLVVNIYVVGLALLAAWWLVGFVALRRVLRAARPAPEWCRKMLSEIAGPAADRVTLLVSPRARQPFTFGWRRAVILLPAEMCNSALTTPELRWSLAHEYSHVVHGDVCIWSLAGLVRTVYFYQPLCWWLRAQLRLCQDYLADAAAAGVTSPEAYAEFLTTRAAGRPLAYGLGIAAGKSDLVRRVAMLVKNRKTLESRCPWWWTAAAAWSAIVVILVAATFGNNPPLAAADEKPRDVKVTAQKSDSTSVAQTKPTTKPGKSTPAKVEKESGDSALKTLLDGLFAREKAIKSGQFTARIEWGQTTSRGAPPGMRRGGRAGGAAVPPAGHAAAAMRGTPMAPAGGMSMMMAAPYGGGPSASEIELIVSGDSWLQRPGPSGEYVFINHGGRSLSYRGESNRKAPRNVVTIDWPAAPSAAHYNRQLVPHRGGTIWYPESADYLRDHADSAILGGNVKINGIEAQAIEWTVPAADTAVAFNNSVTTGGLLAGGGTCRVAVSPQLGYAVVRIEYIDRFGTAQSVFDYSQFQKVAAGIHFPQRIEIRELAQEQTIDVVSVAKINEKIEGDEFVLSIPPGTHVHDVRPHRHDTVVNAAGGRTHDTAKYPLRSFTTGAEYPEGLPAAMLAEMDRDVIPPEEFEKREAETTVPKEEVTEQKSPDALSPAKSDTARKKVARKEFTYGGKSLDAWGEMLLEDLEPETRVKALTALGAFAANGYAEEVAGAIGELLKNDEPNAAVGTTVQKAACDALVRCGAAGVPTLDSELASKVAESRRNAVFALAGIAPSSEVVAVALLKAVKDPDVQARMGACRALATSHLQDPGVADALAKTIRDERVIRQVIVGALSQSSAPAETVVGLAKEFLEDDDSTVVGGAAAVFAARVPATEENSGILRTAVLAGGSQERKMFVDTLRRQQQSREISPELTIPVLLALLESRDSYGDLNGYQVQFVTTVFEIIDKMPSDNATVRTSIPVLIKAVDLELPDKEGAFSAGYVRVDFPAAASDDRKATRRYSDRPSLVLAAAESLGRFGPAAKDAVPSLKKLLEPGWLLHKNYLQDVHMETEKQWQNRIQSIIDKIEGK
jgi:beta-lactamase regulating signal transducer with metallopeptidase domain